MSMLRAYLDLTEGLGPRANDVYANRVWVGTVLDSKTIFSDVIASQRIVLAREV